MKKLIYRQDLFGKTAIGITNGFLSLLETDNATVDILVEQHHYSHKATQNRFKSFLVNENMGFLQLGYGIRPHIKHTISKLITTTNYCEFDRMWLSDDLPKNSETQVISLLLTYLKLTCPHIHFVITYADGSVGNKGTIYRASNAIPLGSIAVDFYLLPNGERIHPVTMWHRHKTRAWSTMKQLYPGIRHITEERQYRFLYILNNKMLKQFWRGSSVKRDTPSNQLGKTGAVPVTRLCSDSRGGKGAVGMK